MAQYTFLDYAEETLTTAKKPLTPREIWDEGRKNGLDSKLSSKGKTPWQSVSSGLLMDREKPRSRFILADKNPATYWVRARESELSKEFREVLEVEKAKGSESASLPDYKERELHPVLAYVAYTNTSFNRGKPILSRTIYHEQSRKKPLKKKPLNTKPLNTKPLNKWVHPDMVGVYLPLEDWEDELVEFNKSSYGSAIRLFSFELKRRVDRSNYRQYFFQAVSNSSWANEGYLVVESIEQDDSLMLEIRRLSGSFGIGILVLDLKDIESSQVLFPARSKDSLDWELMNKLCEQNKRFETFIADVRKAWVVKAIHKCDFDEIREDIEAYIKKEFGSSKDPE